MLVNELDILKNGALKAGEIALEFFQRDPKVWEKDDGQGPVSEADLAVNTFIHDYFSKHMPESHLLSEEDEDDLARLTASSLLVADPIDGTKAYLEGQKFFGISIALLQNNEVVAGVIYAPVLNLLYSAHKGGGAFCNDKSLELSACRELSKAKILASNARYNRAAIDRAPPLETTFRPSIALRLGLVASGQFDLTFGLRPSWDWDIAAGDLIITEAGGVFVDQDGRRPVYNQRTPQQNGIVAGSQVLVEEFLKRI